MTGGTKFTSNQMKSEGIYDNSTTKFKLKGSGGFNKDENCRVAFYGDSTPVTKFFPPPFNIPDILKDGQKIKINKGNVSSMHVFKKVEPILPPGKYKIQSRRTGNYCYTYYELDFWGDKTGNVFWQCDNTGNGKKKDNVFELEQVDPMNPYRYYISQGKRCKHQQIGAGYNIKCDNEGSESSSNSKFKITKASSGYFKIKNEKTGKYCRNRRDILMPGGGIIACDVGYSRGWEEYKFRKV